MSQSTATQTFILDGPEAVMTPREASTLKLIKLIQELKGIGVDDETILLRLPGGAQSLDALDDEQTKEAIKIFTHWLTSYREVVKESVTNG